MFPEERRTTNHLLYLAGGLLAVALVVDLAELGGACLSLNCEAGSFFLGSTITVLLFLLPGMAFYFTLPKALRRTWFAIVICVLLWAVWIVLRALMTDGEEFTPSLLSVICLVLLYKLIVSTSSKQTQQE